MMVHRMNALGFVSGMRSRSFFGDRESGYRSVSQHWGLQRKVDAHVKNLIQSLLLPPVVDDRDPILYRLVLFVLDNSDENYSSNLSHVVGSDFLYLGCRHVADAGRE